MKKIAQLNFFIIGVFVLFLSLPAIFGLLLPSRTNSQIENRRLADIPEFPKSWVELKQSRQKFDDYYADHFGYRWTLLNIYRHLKYHIGDSPSETTFFGRNKEWIFYKNKSDGDIIGDYRNINQFTDVQLATIVKHLQQKQLWLAQQGIEYLFVIAPSKHYIYPEQLPGYIKRIKQQNLVDQLDQALRKKTDVNFINLTPYLKKAKSNQLLYIKGDTHWNYFGSNIAQFEIAKKLQEIFPDQISPTLKPYEDFTQIELSEGDMAKVMGLGRYFVEEKRIPDFDACTQFSIEKSALFSTHCSQSDMDVLVFRDSFFTHLQAYVSQYFQDSTFVWQKMTFSHAEKLIKLNKPDVVIEQWVDRYFPNSLPPEYIY